MGSKLFEPRAVSFWSDDKSVIARYAMPKYLMTINKKMDAVNYGNRILIVMPSKEDQKKLKKDLLNKKDYVVWAAEYAIPGNDKALGIGHNAYVREFAIDRDVTADKIYRWYPTEKDLDNIIFFDSQEDRKKYADELDKEGGGAVSPLEHIMKRSDKFWNSSDGGELRIRSKEKTNFFRNEFVDYVNSGQDFVILADTHIGKDLKPVNACFPAVTDQIRDLAKKVVATNSKYLLILGDFIDKRWFRNPGYYVFLLKLFFHILEIIRRQYTC